MDTPEGEIMQQVCEIHENSGPCQDLTYTRPSTCIILWSIFSIIVNGVLNLIEMRYH